MKVAIITDLHFGVHGSDVLFRNYLVDFLEDTFFPTLAEREINTIFVLGDIFDKRKRLDVEDIDTCLSFFIERIVQYGLDAYIVAGNHDLYSREKNDLALFNILCRPYTRNITTVLDSYVTEIGGRRIGFQAWNSPKIITPKEADLLFGHLDVVDITKSGTSKTHLHMLEAFDGVYSGHFHYRVDKGNVHYIGTPIRNNRGEDYEHGFVILDLDTLEMEHIANPEDPYFDVLRGPVTQETLDKAKGKIVRVFLGDDITEDDVGRLEMVSYRLEIVDNSIKEFSDVAENATVGDEVSVVDIAKSILEERKVDTDRSSVIIEQLEGLLE